MEHYPNSAASTSEFRMHLVQSLLVYPAIASLPPRASQSSLECIRAPIPAFTPSHFQSHSFSSLCPASGEIKNLSPPSSPFDYALFFHMFLASQAHSNFPDHPATSRSRATAPPGANSVLGANYTVTTHFFKPLLIF
jgi:hypothetical protein